MRANRGFIVMLSLAVTMALPTLAAAQSPGVEAPGVFLPIAVGQKVSVTTADGKIVKGQVLKLSPTTLDIGKGEVLTSSLETADVRRVQVTDSVKNGVIKGALGLGLAGLLVGSFVDAGNAAGEIYGSFFVVLLGGEPEPVRPTHHYLTGAVAGVAIGALVGYALDAGNEMTIFERGKGGTSVAVRPIVSNAGKGVGVQVRW